MIGHTGKTAEIEGSLGVAAVLESVLSALTVVHMPPPAADPSVAVRPAPAPGEAVLAQLLDSHVSSTLIHSHPLSSTLIHSHPLSSTLIHSHPLSSTLN